MKGNLRKNNRDKEGAEQHPETPAERYQKVEHAIRHVVHSRMLNNSEWTPDDIKSVVKKILRLHNLLKPEEENNVEISQIAGGDGGVRITAPQRPDGKGVWKFDVMAKPRKGPVR